MTDYYGCGLHRTDEARELKVRRENSGPMMGTPYKHDGQMHAIVAGDGSVSICHTAPGGQWCPQIFTYPPEKVHGIPLDAWNFECPECEMRGGFADDTFVRRFVAPPDRPRIDSYPLFKRWLHHISRLKAQQERREKTENKEQS